MEVDDADDADDDSDDDMESLDMDEKSGGEHDVDRMLRRTGSFVAGRMHGRLLLFAGTALGGVRDTGTLTVGVGIAVETEDVIVAMHANVDADDAVVALQSSGDAISSMGKPIVEL